MVAGDRFYTYQSLQCIKIDKERNAKEFNTIFKNGFNPVLGSIPRLPNYHSKYKTTLVLKYRNIGLFSIATQKVLLFQLFDFLYL